MKIQGQGHDENRPKFNQLIYRPGPTIVPKMKEIQEVVQKLSRRQESAAGGGGGARGGGAGAPAAAYEPVQEHKVTPGIPGWLNKLLVNAG